MARFEIATLAFMAISDPTSFQEAVGHQKWKQAMDAEIQSIERNHTWSLTALPIGAKAIGVKWIYKTKLNELGEVDKYKARLVVKGYAQEYGVIRTSGSNGYSKDDHCCSSTKRMGNLSARCQICFSIW